MNRPDDSPFPDAGEENDEQAEAGSQAQDVADEARARSTGLAEDSERGGRPNPAQIIPDDTPELVERMEEMNRSGRSDKNGNTDVCNAVTNQQSVSRVLSERQQHEIHKE